MGLTTEQIENRKKWVAALTSGQFKQATGALRRGGAYCCLGVACKCLTGKEPIATEGDDEEDDDETLPIYRAVRALTGISIDDQHALAGANDDGRSFNHIANLIENL